MNFYSIAEAATIGGAALLSAGCLMQRLFPAPALWLWNRLLAKRGYRPRATMVSAVNSRRCGSGCSACAGCAAAAPLSGAQPLHFRPSIRGVKATSA